MPLCDPCAAEIWECVLLNSRFLQASRIVPRPHNGSYHDSNIYMCIYKCICYHVAFILSGCHAVPELSNATSRQNVATVHLSRASAARSTCTLASAIGAVSKRPVDGCLTDEAGIMFGTQERRSWLHITIGIWLFIRDPYGSLQEARLTTAALGPYQRGTKRCMLVAPRVAT